MTTLTQPQTRKWTRDEYYRLAAEGYFSGQRVLLLDGEIIQMAPQGHPHTKTVHRVQKVLEQAFGMDYWIRVQSPLNVGTDSDPEPDIAVVKGRIEDFPDHPATASLVVEVSDSSLSLDKRKAVAYASANVAEYWIIDLNRTKVIVYRSPEAIESNARFRYAEEKMFDASEIISPVAMPKSKVSLAELFK